MLSLPETDNTVGTQTIEGMWTLVLRAVPIGSGECNVLFLFKLKYVQCLAEFSFQHNGTRVCQFHPTFPKDANQVERRL